MMARTALVVWLMLLIGLAQVESVGAQDIAHLQAGVVKITAKPPQGTHTEWSAACPQSFDRSICGPRREMGLPSYGDNAYFGLRCAPET